MFWPMPQNNDTATVQGIFKQKMVWLCESNSHYHALTCTLHLVNNVQNHYKVMCMHLLCAQVIVSTVDIFADP